MPAERTMPSRCSGADGNQLVWTIPTDPAPTNNIAFAPNVTPGTFNDPPPMADVPSSEYILFPPPDGCPSPRRPAHSKKKPENHIPRPPNAFILFRSSFIKSQHVSTEVETNHSTLSKIIGLTWQNLPNDERQLWHAKAKAALNEHKRKFPQYAFRPLHSKGKGGLEKRKVREVGPKDHKRCAKIAELLVNGTKGQELDAAIQEFDKHHVPEVVTRFEAPLTARMYRRSSSAPALDTNNSKPQPFLSSTPSTAPRKVRAQSSQPAQRSTSGPPVPSSPYDIPDIQASPESYCSSPSYDQYSFTSKQESSFDLGTFSFGNLDAPITTFSCNPFSAGVGSLSPLDTMFNEHDGTVSTTPPLSIDTSCMNNWTRCSSPMSSSTISLPATPSFTDSPSLNSYPSWSLESFDTSLARPFEDLSHFITYPSTCSSQFSPGEVYSDSPSELGSFDQDQPKIHMMHSETDLSAFMASLPQYTL